MYMFEPIAVENLGALVNAGLLVEPGRRISSQSGDVRESSHLSLRQRISVAIQRFNSVLLHDSDTVDIPDLWPSNIFVFIFCF